MKKVIIALLVIASLFAFVSCKDEVTYDKFAKMPFLDTTEGEGKIFDTAYGVFFDPSNDFSSTAFDTSVTFTCDNTDVDGTLIAKYNAAEESTVYEFNGTVEETSVKGFKFTYGGSSNFLSVDGKELPEEKNIWALRIYDSFSCCDVTEAETTETYEVEYTTGSELSAGTSKISAIKVNVSGTGYNEKVSNIPSALDSFEDLNHFASDYSFEISYDNKTLKATLSTMISEPSSLMTVTIGKKTYLFRESN